MVDIDAPLSWRMQQDGYLMQIDQLKTENAKLRELAEDMLDCIEIRSAFGRPFTSEICDGFARRASELGIEVDG